MPTLRVGAVALAAAALIQTQTPRFGTRMDYVTTEVIVRDARGVFVHDLTPKEFELLEDGVKQTLTTFILVRAGQVVKEATGSSPIKEGLILPPTKTDAGRVFVVFIDDVNIAPLDTIKTRRVMNQIRDAVLRDGDLLAVVSTGTSSIQGAASYDVSQERFTSFINRTMGSGMTSAEILSANQTSQGPTGLRYQAHVAFRTAYDVLEQLSQIKNRRKAFLYVSNGYDFNPYAEDRLKEAQRISGSTGDRSLTTSGQQFSEAELTSELVALSHAAQRANVTFYTIDPRGLVAGPDINAAVSQTAFRQHIETSTSALKALADETGGFCICNTNDFGRGLRMIDDAMSDYYLIGYASSNSDQTKLRRAISVSVSRPGVTASGYRKEYMLKK